MHVCMYIHVLTPTDMYSPHPSLGQLLFATVGDHYRKAEHITMQSCVAYSQWIRLKYNPGIIAVAGMEK